jgi:hypothetical protein
MFEVGGGILDLAQQQVGTVESPPNSNRQKYGAWFGWNGVAWCCIFLSWLYFQVGSPFPPIQTPKGCAYVPTMVEAAIRFGQWRPVGTYTPKPGDMIVFKFTNRADHIGIVKAILSDGRIWTIEGNTNATGSRTGGGVWEVYRRTRILGYIETKPKADWSAARRWIAGVVLGKTQGIRTQVPTNNWYGEDIKTIQEALNVVKNAGLTVDGDYGKLTTLHMIDWQNRCRNLGLKIDDPQGVFGDYTKWWTCVALQNIRDGKA